MKNNFDRFINKIMKLKIEEDLIVVEMSYDPIWKKIVLVLDYPVMLNIYKCTIAVNIFTKTY